MSEQRCGLVRYAGMGHEDAMDAAIDLGVDGLCVLWTVARDEPMASREDDPFAAAEPLFDACRLPAGHDGPHEYAAGAPTSPGLEGL